MCGRINLRMTSGELQQVLDLLAPLELTPRFNIGPLQQIVTVTANAGGNRSAQFRRWGLVPRWAKSDANAAAMINARSETVLEKPAFREAIASRRCLVPASGFYEWQPVGQRQKQPWHIFSAVHQPLVFAGIYESWTDPGGTLLETVSILTKPANPWMSAIHDRMPVCLAPATWPHWLRHNHFSQIDLERFIAPENDPRFDKTPVSSLVNNVRNDGPECLKPISLQPTLFPDL
jgi:putative SOS response-associated peptidase YedK